MLKIYIKTYNNFLLNNLIKYINNITINKKIAINHIVLPAKYKSFKKFRITGFEKINNVKITKIK
jgi:hypothetical protein